MAESVFWGFLLRCGQGAIEASLTLLVGVVVAGVFRRMLGPVGTRRLFGSGIKGLFRGWLAGMLLPVCSLGVIPVAREMRRGGVPGGTVLAFVLAAPLLNPLSFLYGLTLAEPVVIVTFAALSLVLSTLAGFLWDRVFARTTDAAESDELAQKADAEPLPPVGLRRVLAVFVTAAKELSGRDLAFYAVGIVGSALLSAAIPFGSLQNTMHHSDKSSPLLMTALAVPLYSSPLPGMMKIGLMFEHGNSIGAAFVLFALGIGTSTGRLAWLFVDFGPRRAAGWFAAYVVIILALGYACEPLLYDTRKAEADHTHAFDDYAAPFPAGWGGSTAVQAKLAEKLGPLEQPAVYGFAGLLAMGLVLRRADRGGRVERWLTAPGTERARSKWDVVIPGPVLGAVALVGLVAFSVVGAYLSAEGKLVWRFPPLWVLLGERVSPVRAGGPMTTLPAFRTPPRILIPKLVRSRDAWKAKATTRKAQRKALEIRVRDLEASRDLHRQRAEQLQERVTQLEAERADAKRPAPAPLAPPQKATDRVAGTTRSRSSTSP